MERRSWFYERKTIRQSEPIKFTRVGGENLHQICHVPNSLTMKVAFSTALIPFLIPLYNQKNWPRIMWASLFITSVSTITLRTVCNKKVLKMRHLLQDFKWIFHYYKTCVVELWVGRSYYPNHFCLLFSLLCKKYRKKRNGIFPPPPGPGLQTLIFTSLWLYLLP